MDREVYISLADGQVVNKTTLLASFVDLPNGRYLIKISPKKKRTLPQNAYYWGCVVPMVKEGLRDAGYDEVKTNEDAHSVMKRLFLDKQIASEKMGGLVLEMEGSTTGLTTTLFNEYLESIYKWAAEFLNVVIPGPNQPIEMF